MLMGSVGVVAVTVLLLVLKISSEALQREKFVVQPHPVQFNEEPHNWTVTEGASVNLTCNTTVVQVIGYINENTTPLPQIKWFHNNVMIDSSGHFTINNHGIDTSILTIRNVTSLEQGEYYCVVNEWVKPDGDWWTKTRSKSGHITVVSNNSILSVNTENHVVLSCVEPTAVIPDSGVVWIKDGVEMSENMMEYSSNLILNKVSKDHSGHYKYVERMNKSNTLCSYTLTVQTTTIHLRTPLKFHNMKENHFIKIRSDADVFGCRESPVNQSVIMNCNADGHQTMKWYKNGELLDLNSEGTMFNQTTGDLVIRREDACELLGVYQCFASNEIDTVHVSTRVLPLGWPNHPGRPELLHSRTETDGFELDIKLYHPHYLAGVDRNLLAYDIYFSQSKTIDGKDYKKTVSVSNASDVIVTDYSLTSTVRITELEELDHIYFLSVQLIILSKNLSGIAALPRSSPKLHLHAFCDLVGYPSAKINHSCMYNDTSGLKAVYNFSWYIEGSVLGKHFQDIVGLWKFNGECYYPNGTKQIVVRIRKSMPFAIYYLQVNSTCNVTIQYSLRCDVPPSDHFVSSCSGEPPTSSTPPDDGEITQTVEPGTAKPATAEADGIITVVIVVTLIAVISTACVIITIVVTCCWKFSHREPSATEMLDSVKVLNKIQLSGPVSVGARSEVGLNASCSDIYLEKVTEKVTRWLEDELGDETSSSSAFDAVSLRSTEMLDQIVQGRLGPSYVSPAQCMPTRDATLENTVLSSPAIASITSKDSYTFSLSEVASGGLPLFQYMGHKQRLLSTDSGVECNHRGVTNNSECPCKRNEHVVDPLTEATSRPSTHNLHSYMHNELHYTGCSLLLAADNSSNSVKSNSEPEVVEGEGINSNVFKSTEQNGNYIMQETFNEMGAIPHTLTTQQVGNYIRPETLNMCINTVNSTHCHQGRYNGSVSTDSGHVDDKSMHSDEATTEPYETQQDLQFNSDGYVTSPVD